VILAYDFWSKLKKAMAMKYIVYVSKAKAPLDRDQLAGLLDASRRRNTADGITGLLLYRYSEEFEGGYFIQAIEGPEDALSDLWRRISSDRRHHTIVTLSSGTETERMFPEWSMGFKNVDAQDLACMPGFTEIDSEAFWQNLKSNAMPEALELLRGFVDGT
jgi:hypothetical protein